MAHAESAGDLVRASRECTNDLCRFTTLQKALRAHPGDRDAQLALAEYYVNRNQDEAARQALDAIIAANANDFAARRLLAELSLRHGERAVAERQFRSLEALVGDDAQRLGQLASGYERLELIADAVRLSDRGLHLDPADRALQAMVIRLGERARDAALLRRTYELIHETDPSDVATTVRLARLYASTGEQRRAERLLKDAVAQNDSDELKLAVEDLHRDAKPTATDPLRSAWATGSFTTTDPDAEFLVPEDKWSASGSPEADAYSVADVRVDRVRPNGLATIHVQQVFRVNTPAAAHLYSTRNVQYAPGTESLTVLHARVHKRNGRTFDAEDGGDEHVADRNAAMYYDVRSRVLRYPSVEPGDFVELEYRLEPATNTNPYGKYFASLQMFTGTLPTGVRRYVVIAPREQTLYVNSQGVDAPRVSNSDEAQTFVWETANVAALANEPLGPSATESGRYVHVSTVADMNALGRWYADLLAPQIKLSPALQQIASEFVANYPDPRDRVKAVYDFVLTRTHYVALEFGIYSYKPYPVSDVFARGFGDCKDKAALMIALLRASGIQAEFALLRTRQMGAVTPAAASVALFNHAIVYLPGLKLWLDGTADYYRMGELPLEDQGAMALTVAADGESTLRTVPLTSAMDNITSRIVEAQIENDGTIHFNGNSVTRGEDAPALRRDYEVSERQRETVRRALADVFPTVRLDAVQLEHTSADTGVGVRFAGVIDSFAGQRVLNLKATWMQRDYVRRLALLSTRTQDLLLGAPWMTNEEFVFALPRGARVEQVPAPAQLETPFGTVEMSYVVEPQQLRIRSKVVFTRSRIAAVEYPEFRAFCAAADQAFRREIRVVLP